MIHFNYNISNKNTFGLNCVSKAFIEVKNEEDLDILHTIPINERKQILGGGSNSVFIRDFFDGYIIWIKNKGKKIVFEDKDSVIIEVCSGEDWGEFVEYCVENNYSGVENLAAIPGDVGASPVQNIGAYGGEIKDVFYSCDTYSPYAKEWKTYYKEDLKFDYRYSIFKYQNEFEIIWKVRLKLSKHFSANLNYYAIENEIKKNNLTIKTPKDISDLVTNLRNSKLPNPKFLGNCGSFFKNPIVSQEKFSELINLYPEMPNYPSTHGVKLAAGWLIEVSGWKGKRVGSLGMHEKQALVMVNYSDAKGVEILELSKLIIESIKDKFGIELEIEAHLIE